MRTYRARVKCRESVLSHRRLSTADIGGDRLSRGPQCRANGGKPAYLPRRCVCHHRKVEVRRHGIRAACTKGDGLFFSGAPRVGNVSKCLSDERRPYVGGGALILLGKCGPCFARREDHSSDWSAAPKTEQVQRLTAFFALCHLSRRPSVIPACMTARPLAQRMTELKLRRDDERHTAHTVCICTYKRPFLLQRLLHAAARSGYEPDSSRIRLWLRTTIICELPTTSYRLRVWLADSRQVLCGARQGIPLVRTKPSITQPATLWPSSMTTSFRRALVADPVHGLHLNMASTVYRPVKRHFAEKPPNWIMKGNFRRPTYPTGLIPDWSKGGQQRV